VFVEDLYLYIKDNLWHLPISNDLEVVLA